MKRKPKNPPEIRKYWRKIQRRYRARKREKATQNQDTLESSKKEEGVYS